MEEKVLTKEEKEKLRKERQKRRKYRLLILLLLMLGTGTMLATSTYAWFTSNKNVSVETLKVNIEAKNGIQISADGTKWKSIVQKADLVGAHPGNYKTAVNQIPEALEPVSTIAVPDDNGYLPMYYGVVETSETVANNGEYIITATKTTEIDNAVRTEGDTDTAKFIAFDLFFKVNAATPIYLQAGSGVTSADEKDNGIKNASRIAFVKLGETADGSALNTIQALNAGAASTVSGDKVLKDIFRKNPYFKEMNENSFIPQYSELIINGVVLHKVNWITFIDKELLFMNEDAQNIPISSINLENLNSIMIHTNEGIKEVL